MKKTEVVREIKKDSRVYPVAAWLSLKERDLIKKNARKLHQTVSEFIRGKIL